MKTLAITCGSLVLSEHIIMHSGYFDFQVVLKEDNKPLVEFADNPKITRIIWGNDFGIQALSVVGAMIQ